MLVKEQIIFQKLSLSHSFIVFSGFKIMLTIDEIFNHKILQVPRAMLEAFFVEAAVLQMLFKIDVLENFTNFTEKHLCWSLFLIIQTLDKDPEKPEP